MSGAKVKGRPVEDEYEQSSGNAPCPKADPPFHIWNPGHGITFSTPPSNQTWRPSQGLSFSHQKLSTIANPSMSSVQSLESSSSTPRPNLSPSIYQSARSKSYPRCHERNLISLGGTGNRKNDGCAMNLGSCSTEQTSRGGSVDCAFEAGIDVPRASMQDSEEQNWPAGPSMAILPLNAADLTETRGISSITRKPRSYPSLGQKHNAPQPGGSIRNQKRSISLQCTERKEIHRNGTIHSDIRKNQAVEGLTETARGPSTPLPATTSLPSYSPNGFKGNYETYGQGLIEGAPSRSVYWSYAMYRGPGKEKVKVHYCKTKADTERIAQLFLGQEVIGFDIEWKANAQAKEGAKKNVSLIQIACEERVALFHIARFREDDSCDPLIAPTFKAIMESSEITKVGVSIKGDSTRLRRFMGINSRGLFELSHLYKLVKYSIGNTGSIDKRLVSLATQVEEHLGLPLWKGDARTSDWSLDLNFEQVQYAASDSYAGFQLFHTMEHKRMMLDPVPPRPYHAELNLPIRLTTGQSIETDDEPEVLEEDLPRSGELPSVEELARDFMKIKLACLTIKRSPKANAQPCKPEVVIANEWVAQWRTTLPPGYKPAAAPASLRAHALWHEQGFSVSEAAALLRDPPLLNATVATYVLDALRMESLPFEKDRLHALIAHVPKSMKGRYKRFLVTAGASTI